MMFGRKKGNITAAENVQTQEKNAKEYLDALSFLSSFVIEKKEALVDEEIKTVREIDKVKESYEEVIKYNDQVGNAVDAFQDEFEKICKLSSLNEHHF